MLILNIILKIGDCQTVFGLSLFDHLRLSVSHLLDLTFIFELTPAPWNVKLIPPG